ncbi:hypothetical protein Q9L58_010085 [Maublancomyces gigas]|uniref:Uncharacterized protein n=1 Tax=Discina gigas TaxID=1032678 RepID=A0ABR3G5G6_9PEZI
MHASKTAGKPISFCCLKRRSSFFPRFLSLDRTRANSPTIAEKSALQTPYVPTYAASSFLSSTTPVTLDERYDQKQLLPPARTEDRGTIAERADAMRQRGREKGEIKLELVTY